MFGWFQFQHGNGTTDSWTIDSVNISLSITVNNDEINSESKTGTGISWIYGVIGGIAILITALVVFIAVQCCRKRPKIVNEIHTQAARGMEFQNPMYENPDATMRGTSESSLEKNDTVQPMQTFSQ